MHGDRGHRLVGLDEGLEQGDGRRVVHRVPQRAGVEHRIEIFGRDLIQTIGVGQQRLRFAIPAEALGGLGLASGSSLFGSSGGSPLGRGEHHLRSGILEDVVRRGEFLQPEAGLLPVSPSWSWDVSTMRIFMEPPW